LLADEYPALYKVIDAAGEVGNEGDKSYLIYMAMRLLEMHRILKETGSIYLHCDPTMSHSLKMVMDAIFGEKNFLNEIIWSYRTGGVSKRWFGRKHDTILLYAKKFGKHTFNLEKEKSYNRDNKPYKFSNVKEYQDAEGKWYTMASLRDVWEINAIGRSSKERVGYPTQKPRALLERIIKVSSNDGDMVLDPFCGCATACIAATDLSRQWVGIDISPLAATLIATRMKNELRLFGDITHRTDIPMRTEQIKKPTKNINHILFGQQEGKCRGCGYSFPFQNFTRDHKIPLSKGGADTDKNLQLLCARCNSIKGNRTMEYLISKLIDEGTIQKPAKQK